MTDFVKKMSILLILIALMTNAATGSTLEDAEKYYRDKKFKEALALYQKACDQNTSRACYKLGFMYENKQKVSQNFKKAFVLYKKSCDLGDAKGCYKTAVKYEKGDRSLKIKRDYKKAEKYYQRSCTGEFELSCYELASLYQYSLEPKKNEKKMAIYYARACNEGALLGCYKIAHYYERKEDFKKAKQWYKIGCDREDTQACFRLVDIYIKEMAQINPRDFKRELTGYKKRCKDGDTMGCYKMAAMYSTGRGVKQSYRKAKEIFVKGCEMGDNASCMEGYMMIQSGF